MFCWCERGISDLSLTRPSPLSFWRLPRGRLLEALLVRNYRKLYVSMVVNATELKNVCACARLTLFGAFSIVWSMNVYPLQQRCSCAWFPGDYQFWQDGTWRILRTIQCNKKSLTYWTPYALSTKTNFSEVVHPLNFSKNNFPFLKARPNSYLFTADLVFSL